MPLSQSDLESEYLHLSKVRKAIAVILSLKNKFVIPLSQLKRNLNASVALKVSNKNSLQKKKRKTTHRKKKQC